MGSKVVIHNGEDKGDGLKAVGCSDGGKGRTEKRTLKNSSCGHERTTNEGPYVVANEVSS